MLKVGIVPVTYAYVALMKKRFFFSERRASICYQRRFPETTQAKRHSLWQKRRLEHPRQSRVQMAWAGQC